MKGVQSITTHVMPVGGTEPRGADLLRERARWAAAERRWHQPHVAPTPPGPPTIGRGALRRGAQLTRLTACIGAMI